MDNATLILLGTAASIGFVHTLVGVDHSLPFVVLARSQRWSLKKLWAVTAICGGAHILSSVVIGTVGIAFGVALGELELIESVRGGLAARLLIGFGLAYMVWGIYRSLRDKKHTHAHAHDDGTVHHHEHNHHGLHTHAHSAQLGSGDKAAKTLTLLGLLVVFVLGPCEALIPMVMAPAVDHSWATVVMVCVVFGVATLATMMVLVTVGYAGMRWRGFATLERHLHAASGFAIAASGLAIELFGV